jgi:uncharacterized protein
MTAGDPDLADTLAGLLAGDFSRLAPRFAGDPPAILRWIEAGQLDADTLAEALSCAAFNGALEVMAALLARGVAPAGGARTGLDALHWAANRGQLAAVRLLLRAGAPLETRSMYGATALGTVVWSALHEPRPDHLAIVEALIAAGAARDAVPVTGNPAIDGLLG